MQHQASPTSSSASSSPRRATDSSLDTPPRALRLPRRHRRRSRLRACPPPPTPDLPATSTLQPSRRRWTQRREQHGEQRGGREL